MQVACIDYGHSVFLASPCEIRMTTYTTKTIDALNPKLLRFPGAPGPLPQEPCLRQAALSLRDLISEK